MREETYTLYLSIVHPERLISLSNTQTNIQIPQIHHHKSTHILEKLLQNISFLHSFITKKQFPQFLAKK